MLPFYLERCIVHVKKKSSINKFIDKIVNMKTKSIREEMRPHSEKGQMHES